MKNREILFRTAHYDYEGNFHSFSNWGFVEHGFASPRSISSCDPTKAIHEQFTGLTDKNGTKIFEGDLLSVYDHYMEKWTTDSAPVIFSHDYVGGWVISNGKENLTLGKRQDKIQVTGNIHDNPTTQLPS